jgi:hypothetical protein
MLLLLLLLLLLRIGVMVINIDREGNMRGSKGGGAVRSV